MTPPDDEMGGDAPGKQTVEIDEQTLYLVVRSAVEDAILGVLGTILLLGIALVIIWVGGALALSSESVGSIALGSLAIASGFYIAATSVEIIPPAREWF